MTTNILDSDSGTWTDAQYRAQCDEVDAVLDKEFAFDSEPEMSSEELALWCLKEKTSAYQNVQREAKVLRKNKAWWQILALSLAGLIILLSAVMMLNSAGSVSPHENSISTKSLTDPSSTPTPSTFEDVLRAPAE